MNLQAAARAFIDENSGRTSKPNVKNVLMLGSCEINQDCQQVLKKTYGSCNFPNILDVNLKGKNVCSTHGCRCKLDIDKHTDRSLAWLKFIAAIQKKLSQTWNVCFLLIMTHGPGSYVNLILIFYWYLVGAICFDSSYILSCWIKPCCNEVSPTLGCPRLAQLYHLFQPVRHMFVAGKDFLLLGFPQPVKHSIFCEKNYLPIQY